MTVIFENCGLSEQDIDRLFNWLDDPFGIALVINGNAGSGKTWLSRYISPMVKAIYGRVPSIYDGCSLEVLDNKYLVGNLNIIIQINGCPTIGNNIRYTSVTKTFKY